MLARRLLERLGDFVGQTRGSVVIIFALALPALLAASGAAVDFSRLVAVRSTLQQAADSAALAGATQLSIANMTNEQVEAAMKAHVLASAPALSAGLTVQSTIMGDRSGVQVAASTNIPLLIMSVFGYQSELVSVTARASLEGETQLCALALQAAGPGAFALTKSARLTAPACSAYSNSVDPQGMQATGSSFLTSGRACTTGGYGGSSVNFSPTPLTGCPTHPDPLTSLVAPTPDIAGCIPLTSVNASTVLSPGTYCAGLSINQSASVTMDPGVYIFTNGDLHITGSASVTGTNVAIYFAGTTGTFKADPQTTINLTAPKTGSLAGVLLYQSANSTPGQDFHISSVNAHQLLGTIYLPVGTLTVDSAATVADASAYTVIVANKLAVNGSANLTLNAMYTSTDVPVPSGVGPSGGTVVLTE